MRIERSTSWPDLIVVLITLLCAPLFLLGLGNTYLWQDEAQTALLARSVLKHGVPMVGHGADSLSAVMGTDAGVGGIYFQVSWLQAYVTAASFSLFGESSWAARVPFAVAGWLCVPLVAWTMRQAGTGRSSARLAAFLVAVNVPFIVSARQARYYALTSAIVLLVTGMYAGLARPTALRFIAFAAAASMLVVSFDVTAIGVLGALSLHKAIVSRSADERLDRRFWMAWGVAFLLLLVWLAMSFTAPSRQSQSGFAVLITRFRYGVPYYFGQFDAHVFPLSILLTLGLLWLVWRHFRRWGTCRHPACCRPSCDGGSGRHLRSHVVSVQVLSLCRAGAAPCPRAGCNRVKCSRYRRTSQAVNRGRNRRGNRDIDSAVCVVTCADGRGGPYQRRRERASSHSRVSRAARGACWRTPRPSARTYCSNRRVLARSCRPE